MKQYSDLHSVFHALSDPTRLAVVQRLGRGPASVSDLAAPFDMALPSFMKHIRLLESSGMIKSEKTGRVRTCAIRKERLAAMQSWLDQQRTLWNERTDRLEAFVTKSPSQ